MKFKDILANPDIAARWQKVRQYFFLRESTYDMTRRCNLTCDGCYFYTGEKQFSVDNHDLGAWRELFVSERERGITYVVLAGAEPSLVPDILRVAFEEIPLGCIATNGLIRIDPDIDYKLHISVWGNEASSKTIRGAECLDKQLENYAGDARAVFIYTFTGTNLEEATEVVPRLCEAGCKVSFNVFSAPIGYTGPLRLTRTQRQRMAAIEADLLSRYPNEVLFSPYNIEVHAGEASLHERFGCTYPRQNREAHSGLGKTFRQYRSDLSWDPSAACCVPDTDCDDCRHYAAGSAIVTSRLFRHSDDPVAFANWLDYVDTYLSVWVKGYSKSPNLIATPADRMVS